MRRSRILLCCLYLLPLGSLSQQFDKIAIDEVFKSGKETTFNEILVTSDGNFIMIGSIGIAECRDRRFTFSYPTWSLEDKQRAPQTSWPSSNIFKDVYYLHTGFKGIAEGPGKIIYMVSDNNNLGWIDYNTGIGFGMPPFNFPKTVDIRRIWIDKEGDLFIAAADSFYIIREAASVFDPGTHNLNFRSEFDRDSNLVVTKGAKRIQRFSLGIGVRAYCFVADAGDASTTYIGTNKGIFAFEKKTGTFINLFRDLKEGQVTVTAMENRPFFTWFSTIEKGMGCYNELSNSIQYFSYKPDRIHHSPVQNFIRVSNTEFLVAAGDSLPALFNTETGDYEFITDTSFMRSTGGTADIKTGNGNLTFLIKGGVLYKSATFLNDRPAREKYPAAPFIRDILVRGLSYWQKKNYLYRLDSLRTIHLDYTENEISILYAMRGFASSDTITFAWKLEGRSDNWYEVPFSMLDERVNMVRFGNLAPGKYVFRIRARKNNGPWLKNEVELTIIIDPPFWQTWWFWSLLVTGISIIAGLILRWRVSVVKKREQEKFAHEKRILELEAKALRAQMNPHFIFNCLNSIKSLIQQHDEEKSVTYLTTFSRLIRNLLNNADKKDISLYDEIETCKLYLQLEAMRFDTKFSYVVAVDNDIDLKSIQVPALIIQPFVENAIWHGIVPRNSTGHVSLSVVRKERIIEIIIDDDGIGREASAKSKSISNFTHQSKGVNLTQSRLELNNLLQQRQAKLEVIDKKDERGVAEGTTVIIKIKEEAS